MTQDVNEFEEVFGQLMQESQGDQPPAHDDGAAPASTSAQDNHEPAPETDNVDDPAEHQPEDKDADNPASTDGGETVQEPDKDQSHDQPRGQEDPGAAGDDGPGDGQQQDTGTDLEELKRRAHGYDSMLGRLEQERSRVRSLEQQLEALKRQQQTMQQQPGPGTQPARDQQAKADIPEDLREDVESFKAKFPSYAAMIEDSGDVGGHLRSLLADYGPEVAAIQARTFDLENRLTGSLQQVQQQATTSMAVAHQERILADNADLAEVASVGTDGSLRPAPGREQQFQEYFVGLENWIASRPYAEATRWMRIKESGTSAQVSELLKQYRESKQQPAQQPSDHQSSAARQARARAAGTVPTRTVSVPKNSQPGPDDFDTTFGQLLGL